MAIQAFISFERLMRTAQLFTTGQVVRLQGTMPLHSVVKFSEKFFNMMREHQMVGTCSHNFGALDMVQVVLMAMCLTTVYVCGWQSSSTASTSNEPGPDDAACTAVLGDKTMLLCCKVLGMMSNQSLVNCCILVWSVQNGYMGTTGPALWPPCADYRDPFFIWPGVV